MPTIHTFDTTGAAYDACQAGEGITDGDILIVHSEGVIGVADTWPFAVTEKRGELHAIRASVADADFAAAAGIDPARIAEARRLAAAVSAAESGYGNYVVDTGSGVRTVYASSALKAVAIVAAPRLATSAINVRVETPADARARENNEPIRWTHWSND